MASDENVAGSFFNPVPDDDGDSPKEEEVPDFDEAISEVIKQRSSPPLASQPSTIGGIPTSQAKGFGKPKESSPSTDKPFVGIGPPDRPVNDISKPEYDDQGYTVYTNEETGEKSRVFEALVEYPCEFTMKIVGANEGTFVEDILQIVADSCQKDRADISYSTKTMGKWISVTAKAPVESAEMLYSLYEHVDRDPRVKFKF